MVFGIPTMAHLSDAGFSGAERAGVPLTNLPILNIERTRKSLVDAFVRFARSDVAERRALAQRTRAFTVDFHGYPKVARRLTDAYDTLDPVTKGPETP
jgi:hypothetical protein